MFDLKEKIRANIFLSIVNLIFITILMLLVVKIVKPNKEFVYQPEVVQIGSEEIGKYTLAKDISLKMGMYYIRLSYETDTDAVGICSVEDASVSKKSLLSNYEHLYKNNGETNYSIWLFENTSSFVVEINKEHAGSLNINSIRIKESNGMWTMLATILIFVAFAVNFVAINYRKILAKDNESRRFVFLALGLIVLIASIPYLLNGIITGADLGYHLHRIEAVYEGLKTGIFPVRIAPRWLYGQGYADPIFYCNLLLVFPALLRLLGFPMGISYQLFAIFINTLTAYISFYSFKRILKNEKIAVYCSAFYTLSQFRIFRFVTVGSLGEGSAVIFMPLILAGLYEAIYDKDNEEAQRLSWIHIAVGYAGILQSHVLNTEISAFITIAICLLSITRLFDLKTIWNLIKGALFAVVLSLWFLIPFLDYYLTQNVHIKNVSARTIQNRGISLKQILFLYTQIPRVVVDENSILAPGGGIILVLGMLAGFCIAIASRRKNKAALDDFAIVCSIVSIISIIFCLKVFPWDAIQSMNPIFASLVSSLQFPFRFLGWGTCVMVMAAGCLFVKTEALFENRGKYFNLAVMIIFITTVLYLFDDIKINVPRADIHNEEAIGFGYISGGEYIIEGTDTALLTFDTVKAGKDVYILDSDKGNLWVSIDCVNESEQDSFIDVPLLNYKGYKAICLENNQPLMIGYNDNNQIRVEVPKSFAGTILVKFTSPFYWRVGEGVSVMALICFWVIRRKKHEK